MMNDLNNFQKNPLKLYVQDIFRAKQTSQNKYIYELFGLTFKNVMLHGVVTSMYNRNDATTNLELSDPTGTVQIYYDSTKSNENISKQTMKDLHRSYIEIFEFGNDNFGVMSDLMNDIVNKKHNLINFQEGDYISVIGDIFVDEMRDLKMVSAYQCKVTSDKYDIVWLEELRYLYEKYYLWNKE